MSTVFLLFFINVCLCIKKIKIASFNTAQLGLPDTISNYSEEIQAEQISQITQSDIDIICLQELANPETAHKYSESLSESYPYSHSEINGYNFKNVYNCNSQQYQLIRGVCISQCDSLYGTANGIPWIQCMVNTCPDQTFQLLYTNCIYCVGYYPSNDIDEAANICSHIPMPPTNLIDGTDIYSKYEIVNQWHFDIPSDATIQRALTLAQIKICPPRTPECDCTDTIIVGCVHLVATDNTLPYIPGDQEQIDFGVQRNAELNAYQTQYLIHNILNEDDFPWNNNDDMYVVKAVFVAGDFNMGNALNKDNFKRWKKNGFMATADIHNLHSVEEGCTYCPDRNGNDLWNKQSSDFCLQFGCDLSNIDIDHILWYGNSKHKRQSIKPLSYQRIFTQLFLASNGDLIELSDHWGVQFEFKIKDIHRKKQSTAEKHQKYRTEKRKGQTAKPTRKLRYTSTSERTYEPTNKPISKTTPKPTQKPTQTPTNKPTYMPTSEPSYKPTPEPIYKRESRAPSHIWHKSDCRNDEPTDYVILIDNSCALSDPSCDALLSGVSDLILLLLDYPMTRIATLDFGEDKNDVQVLVSLNDNLQKNPAKYAEYVRQKGECTDNGHDESDLLSVLDKSLQLIDTNKVNKFIIISACMDDNVQICKQWPDIFSSNDIEVYAINLCQTSEVNNVITKLTSLTYLSCLTEDICIGKTIDEFEEMRNVCLLPLLCTQTDSSEYSSDDDSLEYPTPEPTPRPTPSPRGLGAVRLNGNAYESRQTNENECENVSIDYVIFLDNSCGFTKDDCRNYLFGVSEIIYRLLDYPKTRIKTVMFGQNWKDYLIEYDHIKLQSNADEYVRYIQENGQCTENGKDKINLYNVLRKVGQRIDYSKDTKYIIVSGCKHSLYDNNDSRICGVYEEMSEFGIEIYIVNVIGAEGEIQNAFEDRQDAMDYLLCLTNYDTERVCVSEEAEGISVDQFDDIIDSCLYPNICQSNNSNE